jgi:hypothetical protein
MRPGPRAGAAADSVSDQRAPTPVSLPCVVGGAAVAGTSGTDGVFPNPGTPCKGVTGGFAERWRPTSPARDGSFAGRG